MRSSRGVPRPSTQEGGSPMRLVTETPRWLIRTSLLAATANALIFGLRPMFTYRALEMEANTSAIGLIAGAYAALPLLFSLAVGRGADRFGPRLFILLGAGFCLLAAAGTGVVESVAGLAAMHAVVGLGHVCLLIGLQTLVSEADPQEDRDRRIATLTIGVAIGQMGGPLVMGMLYDGGDGFLTVVTVWSIAGIVSVLLAGSLYPWSPPAVGTVGGNRRGLAALASDVGSILRTRSVLQAMTVSLLALTTTDLVVVYLPAYGEAAGFSSRTVGQLLAVLAGGSLLGRSSLAPLINRFGRRRSLILCLAPPALGLTMFGLTGSVAAGFVALATAGFGLGLGPPLSLAVMVAQVRHGQRGIAIGTRLTVNRVSQLLTPVGVGFLANASGLRAAFLLVIGVLAAGVGVVVRDVRANGPV